MPLSPSKVPARTNASEAARSSALPWPLTQALAACWASRRGSPAEGAAPAEVTVGARKDAAKADAAIPARTAGRSDFTEVSNHEFAPDGARVDWGDADHCTNSQWAEGPSMSADLRVRATREDAPFGRLSAEVSDRRRRVRLSGRSSDRQCHPTGVGRWVDQRPSRAGRAGATSARRSATASPNSR